MTQKTLKNIGGKIYIIIEPGLTGLKREQHITEKELKQAKKDYGWEKNYKTITNRLIDDGNNYII